jgi:enamine deaminase RidA (YjgF/YER057c/UK114 family)
MADKKTTDNSAPQAIWPGIDAGVPKPLMPYSPAIKAAGWVFIAGQLASDFKTGLDPSIKQTNYNLKEQLAAESEFVLKNLTDTIAATGCDINKDMVRIWQWFVSDRPTVKEYSQGNNWPKLDVSPYLRVRKDFISNCPPSSSMAVRELMWRDTSIEIDMICLDDKHESISFGESDRPGEGTPAMRRGDWVFLAAQNAANPATTTQTSNWYEATVEQQTNAVLEKLDNLARLAGSSLGQAVKAEVYIGHPGDFAAMDSVWKKWFPNNPPARLTIPYMGMGDKGSRVEVALTLLADDATLKKETIETSDAAEQPGHEPQAVKVGNLLFFSSQMAFDSSGNLADGMVRNPNSPWYGSPGQMQMHYMMKNVNAISEAAGTTVENIVRRACFHNDLQWFSDSIQAWASYFPGDKPPSTTVGLDSPFIVDGSNTLLDLIAYVPD